MIVWEPIVTAPQDGSYLWGYEPWLPPFLMRHDWGIGWVRLAEAGFNVWADCEPRLWRELVAPEKPEGPCPLDYEETLP